jgi:hypothetical protein
LLYVEIENTPTLCYLLKQKSFFKKDILVSTVKPNGFGGWQTNVWPVKLNNKEFAMFNEFLNMCNRVGSIK